MTEAESSGAGAPATPAAPVPEQAASVDAPVETPVETSVDLLKADRQTPEPQNPPPPQRVTFQSMADRLTLGLVAAVLGSVLVFVSAFLTWASVDARSAVGGKVYGAVTDSLGVAGDRLGVETLVLSLGALATIAVILLPATKPWAWKVLLGFGLLTVLFAVIELLSIPRTLHPHNFVCPTGVTCSFHRSIGPGVWFTLVAGAVLAAGAYVHHLRPVAFRPHSGAAPVAGPAAGSASPANPPTSADQAESADLSAELSADGEPAPEAAKAAEEAAERDAPPA